MIEEDRKSFKLTFKDQRRIINKEITLLDLVVEKEEEIERLNNIINNDFSKICREKMIDKLSANEMILLQDKEIERLNNIINTMLDFNFFKEECPLNFGYTEKCDEEKAQDVFYENDYCEENCNDDYKKCWLKYFEKLQELKGVDKK